MSRKVCLNVCLAIAILSSFIFTRDVSGEANDLEWREVPGEVFVKFAPKHAGVRRSTAERNSLLSVINAGTVEKSFRIIPDWNLI
jgi:hypothetical protein